jgi:hypothetical protein
MPAQYLDEFIRELRRDGDVAFRSHHASPVLIVTRAAGEMKDENTGRETTVMADTSGWRIQQVSLINRVLAVSRGAFEKAAPMALGRSDTADIVIPDDSISKRHCVFEDKPEGMTVMDCESTNGTTIGGEELVPNKPVVLAGGESLSMGNFSFLFHTADGFVAYLKRVVKL